MSKQPETMDELVVSIHRLAQSNPYAVVPTLATRTLQSLPTGHRAIAETSLTQHLAVNMAIATLTPGEEYVMRGQTDQYYLTNDHDRTFVAMRANALNLAARLR